MGTLSGEVVSISLSDPAGTGTGTGSGSGTDERADCLIERRIPPVFSSAIYTIIGLAWPIFGCVFIYLLCDKTWHTFKFQIVQLFPLVVLFALIAAHFLAVCLESDRVTSLFYFFKRGMPLLFYRRFASVQEASDGLSPEDKGAASDCAEDKSGSSGAISAYGSPAITFGTRRILLSCVDELYLTFLGTLEIRSYAASGRLRKAGGETMNRADLIAKVPLSILGPAGERELIGLFRKYRPDLLVNKRLDDRLSSPIVKGQALIQSFGAVILVLALVDVSYATFSWLEIIKNYYCAQLTIRHPDLAHEAGLRREDEAPGALAEKFYEAAEDLRLHPSPFSWAYRALFANANSQAQLLSIKAETLYRMGRRDAAVEALEKALELSTTGYKAQMQLSRYLAEGGRNEEALAALAKVVKKHKEALLPRVYGEAVKMSQSDMAAEAAYKQDLADLDEEVFEDEPAWPPGGEKPLMEVWRRDDLTFIADRLILKRKARDSRENK